jgi:hypothetical protein
LISLLFVEETMTNEDNPPPNRRRYGPLSPIYQTGQIDVPIPTPEEIIMDNDIYRTSDFGQVVFLLCHDSQLVGAQRIAPARVEFAFKGKAAADGLIQGMFYSDQVSLSRALHEIRKARKIIHDTD